MDKRSLSERDICTKFITPALRQAGWDEMLQIREEVELHQGPHHRARQAGHARQGQARRLHPLLQAEHPARADRGQGQHPQRRRRHAAGPRLRRRRSTSPSCSPRTATASCSTTAPAPARTIETNLALDAFPSPADLWARYRAWKGLTPEAEQIVLQDYFDDGSGKAPRYYQVNAVNAAIEAIAKGRDRILLVMATGTGKTYTAFQIIWRLWKAGPQEAHPVPRRPQRADRPDDGERLPPVRRGDGEALDQRQDHRARRRHARSISPPPSTRSAASTPPTRSISASIRRSPARRSGRSCSASSRPASST